MEDGFACFRTAVAISYVCSIGYSPGDIVRPMHHRTDRRWGQDMVDTTPLMTDSR